MVGEAWSDQALDAARREGDPEADLLAAQTLMKGSSFLPDGRARYNDLRALTQTLVSDPALALARGARATEKLRGYPPELVDYFMPVEVPAWVDDKKLALAGRLWDENTLAIIQALYAASLPACYLLRKGIVALYETARLIDHRYTYQRIYETGLFVEAVMRPRGLHVFSDIEGGKRYLWGKGFVYARQVRFLHASMRFMLTQPQLVAKGETENRVVDNLDASHWRHTGETPINQEDLAFTLLTFGYLIPDGVEKLGCRLRRSDKEAVLHLWKLVGHVMGIKPELTTDDWDKAPQLFAKIRARQAGASWMGCLLADSVMDMLEDYLPGALGIARYAPPLLIRHQLGTEYADMIFTDDRKRAADRLFIRGFLGVGLGVLHVYYGMRNAIFRRSRLIGGFMGGIFAYAANELINSWRDEYRRRMFDVPQDATKVPELTEQSLAPLRIWRRRLYYTISAGVGLFVSSMLLLVVAAGFLVLGREDWARNSVWLTLAALILAVYFLTKRVELVARARPKRAEDAAAPA
jgi:hypothetical protein